MNFESHTIKTEKGDVNFILHKTKNSKPRNLVIYLQGTTPIPEPFFKITKSKRGYSLTQYIGSDYELLNKNYAYVVVGLTGVPIVQFKNKVDIEKYHHFNSLTHRVFLVDKVINYIEKELLKLDKIIVYGHSEGAPVAAKLATINKKITHLGFWGGNALPDFYDFILFERKNNLTKRLSDSLTHQKIKKHINTFKAVSLDTLNIKPKNDDEISEYTNKRWWSYAEPPINNLLKLEIPIYLQTATEDQSAPIESNYLVPLEFIRLGKTNLTFNVCIGCDHSFINKKLKKDFWEDIFIDFIKWSEQINNKN